MIKLDPHQIRAARALLDWTHADLAKAAGMTADGIRKIEKGQVRPYERSVNAIFYAFQNHGVEFLENSGVRFKPEGIQILEGRDGLIKLLEDILDNCKRGVRDIVLNGVSEDDFQKVLGDWDNEYLAAMSSIKNLKMRTLIREGDTNVVSSAYSEYRWASKDHFDDVPFYAYSDKLAIIVFKSTPSPRVFIIQSQAIADAYRRQFESMWKLSKPINAK